MFLENIQLIELDVEFQSYLNTIITQENIFCKFIEMDPDKQIEILIKVYFFVRNFYNIKR